MMMMMTMTMTERDDEIINSQSFPLQVLTMVHDTQIEVQARRTVATWAQQAWSIGGVHSRITIESMVRLAQALLEKNQMIVSSSVSLLQIPCRWSTCPSHLHHPHTQIKSGALPWRGFYIVIQDYSGHWTCNQ